MKRYRDFAKSFSMPLSGMDIAGAHNGLVRRELSNQQGTHKAADLVYESVSLAMLRPLNLRTVAQMHYCKVKSKGISVTGRGGL
jgi:hypothetical protein